MAEIKLENITYLSKENHLYLILDGNLYNIGLEQKSCEILNSNLVEETYKVSESGRMICWLKENRPYESNSLVWMNLSDGKQIEVKAGFGERISILGFMGEDLIYGLVKRADMETKANGNVFSSKGQPTRPYNSSKSNSSSISATSLVTL